MQKVKTIADVACEGKRVFVRVDFNVPLDERGNISDDTRIVAALPTIKYLMQNNAKIILASHLGRPKGQKDQKYSLRSVALALAKHIEQPVLFLPDCIGNEVEQAVSQMSNGNVILLENLRFYSEETDNDPKFAKKLASLADIYVNDAFGTAHRAHASTEGITKYVKTSVAGFLVQKELEFLGDKVSNPEHPFVVILGGAKVSDKIKVINNLLDKCDAMLIGGAMAYTFLAVKGFDVGKSLIEKDKFDIARAALDKAEKIGVKLLLPIDHIVSDSFDHENMTLGKLTTENDRISGIGVDIGPKTVELYRNEIMSARTILLNGPMGIFEIAGAAEGTFEIAKAVAESNGISIIGGGDSIKALKKSGHASNVTFMSTGGGASLEFLEGTALPGIEALQHI